MVGLAPRTFAVVQGKKENFDDMVYAVWVLSAKRCWGARAKLSHLSLRSSAERFYVLHIPLIHLLTEVDKFFH